MADLEQLLDEAQVKGRIPGRRRALRWLRAVCSTLRDWGGAEAASALDAALPRTLRRGGGSGGLSFEKASERSAGGVRSCLHAEFGRRADEPDPGKVAGTARVLAALIRRELTDDQVATVVAALPDGVREWFEGASMAAPWPFHLIPQPFGDGRRRRRDAASA